MRLTDRVAIVTGASRGIGKGIALRLAREGARVAITARGADALKAAAAEIQRADGVALAVPGDAGSKPDVEALFERVLATWGRLDIMGNNAGWASPQAHFLDMYLPRWETVLRTNRTT